MTSEPEKELHISALIAAPQRSTAEASLQLAEAAAK
jgi:hypothetical protein